MAFAAILGLAGDVGRRSEREQRIRVLVLLANETDDPGVWRQVDELVFDRR